ncbi:LD-carboxypeptidase [Alcaligenes aquatilis]|jgi:muramoyltetrapeptide carboxypeptidase|uniref:LD-carboxypeptidase n=2 Tax=Alcaligenes TaxID=507 RepID=A0AB33CX05_ALCFA|nr:MULTISPECIES: LD-carboxypeptidase [Alcaligenes]ASR89871.1 LD-carboxypeptidase [Alcaligenes faecalis]AWG34679.1 LD-carboxypeptidase [Alcaligenes aquatilis]AYN21088.1 LD-carboxypeptidase [Alcaligenes aquatilis]MCH4224440.1 LD-carboxypeptidase [Alcaligenes faecalis]
MSSPEHDHHHHHHEHGQCHCGQQDSSGIYLFSPSGQILEPKRLELASQRLNQLGFAVDIDPDALEVHERFAGTDAQRLAAVQRALQQPQPIVMATRGGYGLSRILGQIDWRAVADSGKRFVGMSDFTAFNLALLAQTGAISYTGPTAIADFGGDETDELTTELFGELMRGELELFSFESEDSDAVDGHGILWGGNLALVCSLLGTPYFPNIDGGILFLEDVGEAPYRVERMLTQLWHAGVLNRQMAVVLGRFTAYKTGASDNGFDMDSVVRWLRETVKVPVVTGLPYGHVEVKVSLPVGKEVGLATEDGMAYLVLDEHEH